MSTEQILNIILNISAFTIFKLFILLALLIYFVFAVLVVRQVKIMTDTFQTGFEWPLRLVSWLHLGLVILIFIIAILIL